MDIPPVSVQSATPSVPNPAPIRPEARSPVSVQNAPQVDAARSQNTQKNERPAYQQDKQPVVANAAISFEYQDGHRVMKVNDTRGVLIYQVPPKGELRLILEQEHKALQFKTQA